MPDASGYVERTETLALRKELGSGSDVTGSARCWNRFMGDGQIELHVYGGMTDIEADGVGSALWKDLGSGSDMTGVQDGGSVLWIRLRRELGFNSDLSARGECAIQFQDYSEAIVVSMVILEFQATGPR
ncbi:Glutamate Receptor 4 [Manis pentadactyla]|nr:Glutamate Receptor 4 [Manis pentadactyla]